jgi:hypothetical protein
LKITADSALVSYQIVFANLRIQIPTPLSKDRLPFQEAPVYDEQWRVLWKVRLPNPNARNQIPLTLEIFQVYGRNPSILPFS